MWIPVRRFLAKFADFQAKKLWSTTKIYSWYIFLKIWERLYIFLRKERIKWWKLASSLFQLKIMIYPSSKSPSKALLCTKCVFHSMTDWSETIEVLKIEEMMINFGGENFHIKYVIHINFIGWAPAHPINSGNVGGWEWFMLCVWVKFECLGEFWQAPSMQRTEWRGLCPKTP